MTSHKRIMLVLPAVATILLLAVGIIFYARGYKYDKVDGFSSSGILIIKSNPEAAQIFLNDKELGVTNDSLKLSPGKYNVSVKKEGYLEWSKSFEIKTEEVTEVTAFLFKTAPSLSAITLNGASEPVVSHDFTKLAYVVIPQGILADSSKPTTKPKTTSTPTPTVTSLLNKKEGLWVIEMLDLPLGFSRDPKQITDGVFTNPNIVWSPDGQEILLSNNDLTYLLDTSTFTPFSSLSVVLDPESVITKWNQESAEKLDSQMKLLPEEFREVFSTKTKNVVFAPDEKMILFQAKENFKLEENVIEQLPGSSTQLQERDIKVGKTYVYDIKEDRNFAVDSGEVVIEGGKDYPEISRRLSWLPTSRHLILAEPNKITILDHDGTNKQSVYSGIYLAPYAFPTVSNDRLMILTNLGSIDSPNNLYSLGLK